MGAIIVRRTVVGRMSAAVFAMGIAAFLLGFVHPGFFPLAWASLLGGGVIAILIRISHARTSHPTVSHLSPGPEQGRPIEPR